MLRNPRMKMYVIGLLVLMASTACYRFELGSIWAENPVVIDGDDGEWTFPRRVLAGDQGVVGFMNDDMYLYLSYRTTNRIHLLHIINQGFTIWIDPKGGTKKQIGFRYPLGSKQLGISPWDFEPRRQASGYQAFLEQLLLLQPGIEILGSRRDDVAMIPLDNQLDVQVKVQLTKDSFVYEMRLPYGKRSGLPTPIGAAPGRKIGIGIVGGPLQPDRGVTPMGSMATGADDPMRQGAPGEKTDPPGAGRMEAWVTVTLATER